MWTKSNSLIQLEGYTVIRLSEISPLVVSWFIEHQPKVKYDQFILFSKQFGSVYNCLMSYYNGAYEA